jgi:hypothetical protein
LDFFLLLLLNADVSRLNAIAGGSSQRAGTGLLNWALADGGLNFLLNLNGLRYLLLLLNGLLNFF